MADLELIKTIYKPTGDDEKNVVYLFRGIIDRNTFQRTEECAEMFRQCGCQHDCCGHWFASYMIDYHHNRDGNTAVVVRYLKNV